MRAGKLRKRVTIQSVTEAANATYGDPVAATSTFATRFAEIRGVGANERFAADQRLAETTHEIRVRYLAGVTARHRVVAGSTTFDVLGAYDPDGRQRETVILARVQDV